MFITRCLEPASNLFLPFRSKHIWNFIHQERRDVLAFCCCSFWISLALGRRVPQRKPCKPSSLAVPENVLPISLRPPGWVLRLVQF
jgi:hypothetical protein